MSEVTYDIPVARLSFKTADEACETISIVECRFFNLYTEIEDFEEAVMGKWFEEMSDAEVIKYAKWLIENFQGTDEALFGPEFDDDVKFL